MSNYCKQYDYLKLIVSVIIIALALLAAVYFFVTILAWDCDFKLSKCEKLSDVIMAFLAFVTFVSTCFGYYYHRKRDRAEVLSQYNERYSRDEHISKVVPFLIADIMGTKATIPSVHDVEMFMRFFEEMELQIEKHRLDADSVYELFSYYALYFDSKPCLIEMFSIDDYNSNDNWKLFHNFVNRMAKIHFKDSNWISGSKIIEFDECHIIVNKTHSTYTYQSGEIRFKKDSEVITIRHNIRGACNEKNQEENLEFEEKIYTKEK